MRPCGRLKGAVQPDGGSVLFPLTFVFSLLVNLTFFYLGLGFEENAVREYGFIAACVLFAVCCGLSFLHVLREDGLPGRTWLGIGAVALFYSLCGVESLRRFGLREELLQYGKVFAVFVIPAFLVGICGARRGWEDSFFPTLERFGVLTIPGALIYFNGVLFECMPWGKSYLGILMYQVLGNGLLPFLLAYLIGFLERRELVMPFAGRPVKHPQIVRAVFILVLWLSIIASGTRGAYLGGTIFCGALALSKLLHREADAKRAAVLFLLLTGVLLFTLYVYAPLGLDRAPKRVQVSERNQISVPILGGADWEQTDREILESYSTVDVPKRGTLYALALREFLHAPLFGMGPGGFTLKYKVYPHDLILEALCETGIFGTAALLSLLGWAVVRMFRAGRRRKEVRQIILFFIPFAIRALTSGTMWQCFAMLCAIGYGITVPVGRDPADAGDSGANGTG